MYDRKTWIVLAVCGVLLALNFHYSAKRIQPAPRPPGSEQSDAEFARAAAAAAATSGTEPGLSVDPPPPPTEEELVILETDKVLYTFTNIGGGIKHATFKDEFEVGSKTVHVLKNRFGAGPIGGLATGNGDSLENIPYAFSPDSEPGRSVVLIAKLPSGLIVKKTFSLVDPSRAGSPYLLDFTVEFENAAEQTLNLNQWSLFLGESSPLYQNEPIQHTGFFWREDDEMHFEDSGKFKSGMFGMRSAKTLLTSDEGDQIQYAGVSNQFFATALHPKQAVTTTVWARPQLVSLTEGATPLQGVRAGLQLPSSALSKGAQTQLSYELFIGPKHNPMLRRMGDGWSDIMQYGSWLGIVSNGLNYLLNFLHRLFDGVAKNWSWGLAIISLTIVVRSLIWPLHAKSTHTMKRMSKLQPEIAKLKEKYPDDPNKLNQEMMGLYRKFGINPLGGCLPMLIQIPIFFGFFKMLQTAVELRGQSFLWVSDLSQPDTLTTVAGIPINILPIVMGATSFAQIAMTPKTGDKTQQRIMLFMPLIFFIFCYNYASALALYWATQNIFSIGQTWLMNRIPEPELKARKDGGKKSWIQRMAEKQAEMQQAQRKGGYPGTANPDGLRNVTPPDKKKRPPRTGG